MHTRVVCVLLVCLLHASCQKQSPLAHEKERNAEEARLIFMLSDGSVEEKKTAAVKLKEMGSLRAVPHLLREAKRCSELAKQVVYEPDPDSEFVDARKAYVIVDGKKQPYVDYHAHIFDALAALTIPYKESAEKVTIPFKSADEKWFADIEAWWKANGPP